ncbi:uncharacterized protein LOC116253545 isoform X2 [Nymphaea colorata]|uniref:uncharacterized protein LOC116253545 isoform X2 n=1 Tax=Nymphaea colorata TaxID=210225 RepID=UPI00129EDD9A|nr:uncharacterized protein LOC116253545 isoform X2 [Nymphaea colorata]
MRKILIRRSPLHFMLYQVIASRISIIYGRPPIAAVEARNSSHQGNTNDGNCKVDQAQAAHHKITIQASYPKGGAVKRVKRGNEGGRKEPKDKTEPIKSEDHNAGQQQQRASGNSAPGTRRSRPLFSGPMAVSHNRKTKRTLWIPRQPAASNLHQDRRGKFQVTCRSIPVGVLHASDRLSKISFSSSDKVRSVDIDHTSLLEEKFTTCLTDEART